MTSAKTIARVDTLIWTLAYGGLFALVLGLATLPRSGVTGWSLIVAGACVAAGGFALIWVRSRLHEDATHPRRPE